MLECYIAVVTTVLELDKAIQTEVAMLMQSVIDGEVGGIAIPYWSMPIG